MKIYKFWSVNIPQRPDITKLTYKVGDITKLTYKVGDIDWVWLCIPPDESYLPDEGEHGMRGRYPIGAVRKHEEEILPPPSYWLEPFYETIVYEKYYEFRTE